MYITPKLDTEENPAWSEVISGSNIIGDGSDGGFNVSFVQTRRVLLSPSTLAFMASRARLCQLTSPFSKSPMRARFPVPAPQYPPPPSPGLPAQIRTGDFVEVVYAANTSRVTGRRMLLSDQPAVLDFQIIQPGSPKEVFTGDPIQVSSYIYVINTCGWPQSTTTDVRGWAGRHRAPRWAVK